jgi:integrase
MTRLHRLRYVQAFVDRKTGAVFRYFRRPGYPRVRLPGLPGSAEFNRAYEAALEGPKLAVGAGRSKPGSLSVAIASYYASLEFRSLAAGTQAARRAILERFRAAHGDKPIALLPPKFIAHMLSTMKPFAARNWLKAIRHLMQFCVAQEMCAADPTQGIKLPRAKSDGIHSWTEGEISMFEAHHAIGTKPRLALALLLYTSQRRGDVLRMGRQHIRDGVITVRQDKTGTTLMIPVHTDLRVILDATSGEHLTFIVGQRGNPVTPNAFSKWFRDQCDAAGLSEACSAHGLRKAACRRLAEAGCSANEIAAISGHASLREVERYTRAVDQERMARNAMARTKDESRTVKFREV